MIEGAVPVRVVGQAGIAAGVQQKLSAINAALDDLASEGVDALVTAEGPVLMGGARAAVTQSEARYRHLINRMSALVAELSPNGEIIYLNDAITSICGFSAMELTGRDWFDLLLPLGASKSLAGLRELFLQGGELSMYRTGMRCHDRRQKTIAWNSAHVRDGEGRLTRLFLFGTDVIAQVLAEEQLRVSAVAFETQNGILITNPQGVIERINSAFTRLTGFSAEEAVGQTPSLLKSGRQDPLFYRQMWDSLLNKGGWQGEIWNKRKNGDIYAEMLSITAIVTPELGITHFVGNFYDITASKVAEAEIHRLAYYDLLTQLPNRRLLYDRLGQAVAATARSRLYGAMFFIDLDNFKALNDTRGHDVGDLLLTLVAQRLRMVVREGDTVARLGGDEFVVLLEDLGTGLHEAAALARHLGDKLRLAIDTPFDLHGHEYHCRLSIGVGLFHAQDTVEDLFKRADLALYEAKSAGRNSLRFFDPAMQAALDTRSTLEAELSGAINNGQLLLFYQPQVDAQSRVVGVEALLRWQHPQRGLVPPAEFIGLAEETGLILPIGLWVLQTACSVLKTWENNALHVGRQIAVNVSARQFQQAGFVAQVQAVLNDSAANPSCLKLELTESVVLENVEDAIVKMTAIKKMGIRFSMDDFGTGYSSLSYLARLPIDQLKIDQSFVANLPGKNSDETIARTIITLGRELSMQVIAEGVETEAQRLFLQKHGCHAYQGYLYSRPLRLDALNEFLKAHTPCRS
ncbi:MAG: EAL domain-containing protein [Comamonadaceae bacterium]|nr:EAL domain-containing protein [Comamonadaceae bacterium]